MTNRELNIQYDNEQKLKQKTENYDFTEIDLAIRRMVALNGMKKDLENYQNLKTLYQD
jgi:hypothetical protein